MSISRMTLVCVLLLALHAASPACDLCPTQGLPLSAEVQASKAAVFGSIVNAKLGVDGTSGSSELRIEAVLKSDPSIQGKQSIMLARYAPPDPKVKFLVTLDFVRGQLDPYRGLAFSSNRVVKYFQDAPAKKPGATAEENAERLRYFFRFLNDAESELAADAFKEWAGASNREVGLVAPKLPADDLRTWLLDPKTPIQRLSLYGFLLGACGADRDAETLRKLILDPNERMAPALDGLLAGYIKLRGPEGWKLTQQVLADSKRPFIQRHSILRMLRFYQGYEPEQTRSQLLQCAAIMLAQVDMADLAIDHLRRWQLWDHSGRILALWAAPQAAAPITKRAIVRYALTSPQAEAKSFIEKLKKSDPELVNEVQESLQFEQPKRGT